MKLFLFLLFIILLLLPFFFSCLEGMEYSTEVLDKEIKYKTDPEDRILLDLKDLSGNSLPTN